MLSVPPLDTTEREGKLFLCKKKISSERELWPFIQGRRAVSGKVDLEYLEECFMNEFVEE